MTDTSLVGIGLYTPAEASRLTGIAPGKIVRWLRGHAARGVRHDRLWPPQIELDDDCVYLGFRDLMEARVANAFIELGVSPQTLRRVIQIVQDLVGDERPLSTTRFRIDGRNVFLRVLNEDGEAHLLDFFKRQYAFREILEPGLRHVEFDDAGLPLRWWPMGRIAGIVVDPRFAFGRPIEATSNIPSAILAAAVEAEGSPEAAAHAWRVPLPAVRHAIAFERKHTVPKAA